MSKSIECADEIFAELGYTKEYEDYDTIEYSRYNGVKIFIEKSEGIISNYLGYETGFSLPTFKAIAKKIEEKGW